MISFEKWFFNSKYRDKKTDFREKGFLSLNVYLNLLERYYHYGNKINGEQFGDVKKNKIQDMLWTCILFR